MSEAILSSCKLRFVVYYYCACIARSKVIVFAASAIFEIIALKTAGTSRQVHALLLLYN